MHIGPFLFWVDGLTFPHFSLYYVSTYFKGVTVTTYSGGRPEPIVQQLIELLPKNCHVLDIGCGEGRNAIPLARAGVQVEGWDKNTKELKILQTVVEAENLPIKTVSCDMRDFRVGYDRWSAVLTVFCLHFLTPKDAADRLTYIRANLMPGGYHAMVAFTNDGALARLRNDRFYPSIRELVQPYEKWQKILCESGQAFCLQKDKNGLPLENTQLTLLARKPL